MVFVSLVSYEPLFFLFFILFYRIKWDSIRFLYWSNLPAHNSLLANSCLQNFYSVAVFLFNLPWIFYYLLHSCTLSSIRQFSSAFHQLTIFFMVFPICLVQMVFNFLRFDTESPILLICSLFLDSSSASVFS